MSSDNESIGSSRESVFATPTASHLANVAGDEEHQRAQFMHKVNRFMMNIERPLSKIPIMGYKELDLFQLFREVVARGGFNEVVRKVGTWSKIWKRLSNFDPSITDSSFRLRKNYERYLLDYEYHLYPAHRSQEQKPRWGDDDTKSRKKTPRKTKPAREIRSPSPKLPLVLDNGELTIECLGEIVNRSPFVTDKDIFPVGFSAVRTFASMKNPSTTTTYTCEILDGGSRPQFVVTPNDDPNNPVIAESPAAAWRTIMKQTDSRSKTVELSEADVIAKEKALQIGAEERELAELPEDCMDIEDPVNKSISETHRIMGSPVASENRGARVKGGCQFGLTHPLVNQLIKEMFKSATTTPSPRSNFGLGALKRKSSEMSLVDLQGSESEDDDFVGRFRKQNSKTRRQPKRRCASLFDNEEDLDPVEEKALVENAISTLLGWSNVC